MRFQMWSIFTALSDAAGLECDKGGIVADAAADANGSPEERDSTGLLGVSGIVTKSYIFN